MALEFWSAFLGVVVGSALSLLGVWLTLRKQEDRDRVADARRLRDARALRLRSAYQSLTRAGLEMEDFVPRLGVAAAAMSIGESGAREIYLTLMKSGLTTNVADAHASLLLELEEDRAVLDAFETNRNEYTLAWLKVSLAAVEGEAVPVDDFKPALDRLSQATTKLAGVARERLTELEQPLGGPRALWWQRYRA